MTAQDFQQLYREENQRIYKYFRYKGFAHELSRDLTQETFMRAFRTIRNFQGQAKLETWLRRVAIHVERQHLRDKGRSKRTGEEVSIDTGAAEGETNLELPDTSFEGSPLDQLLREEQASVIREEIDKLPTGMKSCLQMYCFQECKQSEIAKTLRVSGGTVKSQLHAARSRLRQALSPYIESHSR